MGIAEDHQLGTMDAAIVGEPCTFIESVFRGI